MHAHSLRHTQNVSNIHSLMRWQRHEKLGKEIYMITHQHNPQQVVVNPSEL
jgi:hypothetical protein